MSIGPRFLAVRSLLVLAYLSNYVGAFTLLLFVQIGQIFPNHGFDFFSNFTDSLILNHFFNLFYVRLVNLFDFECILEVFDNILDTVI